MPDPAGRMAGLASGVLVACPGGRGVRLVHRWLQLVQISGYSAAGGDRSAPFAPLFALGCRLVRAGDETILMRDTIVYNPAAADSRLVVIRPDPRFEFPRPTTIPDDPARAVQGLESAMDSVSAALGDLMR